MSKRYTYEEVYMRISEIGHTLLSEEFKTTKLPLTIKCKCGVIYEKRFDSFMNGSYHCNGKIQRKAKAIISERECAGCKIMFKPRLNRTIYCTFECSVKNREKSSIINKKTKKTSILAKECLYCKESYQPKRNASILCSDKCAKSYQQTDEYRNRAKVWGVKAGLTSVTSQQRRGKNEIYFADLCERHFGKENVLTNEPMFEGWDADVILPSLNTCILWNGIHHYKQVSKTQSLAQVQARDRIKLDVIQKHGYTPYVIMDMGKYNRGFVEMEFECFLQSLMEV